MALTERVVQLKIKLVPQDDTKKALDSLTKVATNWDKVFGPNGDKPVKNQARQLGTLTRAWQDLGVAMKGAHENFKLGFSSGSESMRGIKTFTSGIEGLTKKIFNLKTVIAGTVVGGLAIWGVKKAFEEGAQDIKTRNRLKREFGDKGAANIEAESKRVNFRAGLQDDEVSRGLIPLAEQLEAIQKGSQFRGMKRKLTAKEALALRNKNLTFGANLFANAAAKAPDIAPEELGRILGDALSGPEGVRSLVSALNLRKASRTLQAANEKGLAYQHLDPKEQKALKVTKKGQYLEQGDLVKLMLSRSDINDSSVDAAQKTFSHQIKQIKSTLLDELGDVGAGALDTLTAKLGDGATAAERLQTYLASKEGKKTLESIQETVVKIVEGVVDIATGLPKIGSWLKEHRNLLESLAVAYVGLKAAPALVGGFKGSSAVANATGNALGGATGTFIKQIPLIGTAVAFAAAGEEFTRTRRAGFGGLTVGSLLNVSPEERIANLKQARATFYEEQIERLKKVPERNGDNVEVFGPANRPIETTINITNTMDGQVVGKTVLKHIGRAIENQSGRGTAPGAKD